MPIHTSRRPIVGVRDAAMVCPRSLHEFASLNHTCLPHLLSPGQLRLELVDGHAVCYARHRPVGVMARRAAWGVGLEGVGLVDHRVDGGVGDDALRAAPPPAAPHGDVARDQPVVAVSWAVLGTYGGGWKCL